MRKKMRIMRVSCWVLLVLGLSVLCGCSADQPGETPDTNALQGDSDAENKLPVLTVIEMAEKGDVVSVTTTYGTFEYPAAFSDFMSVKSESAKNTSKLQFFANVNDEEILIYTMLFGGTEGLPLGTIQKTDWAEPVVVTVLFPEEPIGLNESDLLTYYATQETFNNVMFSFVVDGKLAFEK